MSIETVLIPSSAISRVLDLEEGHFADLKAIEVSPAKLTCSLSAFANADGGELYVGVDEDRQKRKRLWRGFASQESANGHIQAFEETFPLASGARSTSTHAMLPILRRAWASVLNKLRVPCWTRAQAGG